MPKLSKTTLLRRKKEAAALKEQQAAERAAARALRAAEAPQLAAEALAAKAEAKAAREAAAAAAREVREREAAIEKEAWANRKALNAKALCEGQAFFPDTAWFHYVRDHRSLNYATPDWDGYGREGYEDRWWERLPLVRYTDPERRRAARDHAPRLARELWQPPVAFYCFDSPSERYDLGRNRKAPKPWPRLLRKDKKEPEDAAALALLTRFLVEQSRRFNGHLPPLPAMYHRTVLEARAAGVSEQAFTEELLGHKGLEGEWHYDFVKSLGTSRNSAGLPFFHCLWAVNEINRLFPGELDALHQQRRDRLRAIREAEAEAKRLDQERRDADWSAYQFAYTAWVNGNGPDPRPEAEPQETGLSLRKRGGMRLSHTKKLRAAQRAGKGDYRELPPVEDLRERMHYDPATGMLVWVKAYQPRRNGQEIGFDSTLLEPVSETASSPYGTRFTDLRWTVEEEDGTKQNYRLKVCVARLIFYLLHGVMPDGPMVIKEDPRKCIAYEEELRKECRGLKAENLFVLVSGNPRVERNILEPPPPQAVAVEVPQEQRATKIDPDRPLGYRPTSGSEASRPPSPREESIRASEQHRYRQRPTPEELQELIDGTY